MNKTEKKRMKYEKSQEQLYQKYHKKILKVREVRKKASALENKLESEYDNQTRKLRKKHYGA